MVTVRYKALMALFAISIFGEYASTEVMRARAAEWISPTSVILLYAVSCLATALGLFIFYLYRTRIYNLRLQFSVLLGGYSVALVIFLVLALAREPWIFLPASLLFWLLSGIHTGVVIYCLFTWNAGGRPMGMLLAWSGIIGIGAYDLIEIASRQFFPSFRLPLYIVLIVLIILVLIWLLARRIGLTSLFEQDAPLMATRPSTTRRPYLWATIGAAIALMSFMSGCVDALPVSEGNTVMNGDTLLAPSLLFLPGMLIGGYLADWRKGVLLPAGCILLTIAALPEVLLLSKPQDFLVHSWIGYLMGGMNFIYIMVSMISIARHSRCVLLAICTPGILYNAAFGIGVLAVPIIAGASPNTLLTIYAVILIALIALFVVNGSLYVNPVAEMHALQAAAAVDPAKSIGLTEREREVLEYIRRGINTQGIAKALFLSQSTVKHHVGRILAKAEVRNRVELLVKLGSTPASIVTADLSDSNKAGGGEAARV